jgi:Na+/phosphate symporter
MTKEDILDKWLQDFPWLHNSKENALKAMQEYAEQMTAELAENLVNQQLQLKEKDKEIHYLQLQVKDLQEQINNRPGE